MNEESLDIFGYDSYPNFAFGLDRSESLKKSGFLPENGLNDRTSGKSLSEVRSICPHFSILEQQSGAGSWVSRMEGPMPRPGQIKLWALQSIAHGADFVSFFRWRTCTFGTEMYWHGILDYDNRDNRRLKEVGEFASTLKKIAPLCGSDYVAPLAIVKDYDNAFDAEIDVWHGRLTFPDEEAIYQEAQLCHIPCNYCHLSDDSVLSDLSKYEVLIYPHPAIMTRKRAALLEAYVAQGGKLILGCRSGYKDETGTCLMMPAPGLLSSLTGTTVQESSFQHPAEPTVTVRWEDKTLTAPVFQDLLESGPDSKVLARFDSSWFKGTPALVEHSLGKGLCLYWGSTFAPAVLDQLFGYTGLTGRFDALLEAPTEVEVIERQKDGRRFLMLLNYLPTPQRITLHVPMQDLIKEQPVSGPLTLEPFGVSVLEIKEQN